ncbi:MAG: carbon-nitrogen hydrolase family protein [Acidobacteria bacterium]|nr:carbon-nitrogen hydrolase family protein [Acidobacteriota bacterium]
MGGLAPALLPGAAGRDAAGQRPAGERTIPVALIQFDSVPEQVERNLKEVQRLSEQAVSQGARWLMFHEGTLCDYTPRLGELAEPVPAGPSTRRIEQLARRLKCFISFGLSEVQENRYYISQVFVGPSGFLYRYRKTWLWRDPPDVGYRNEWIRYDPGTGPETFVLDGVRATCFICADGEAPRCIERAAKLAPQVVFYPNNRERLPKFEAFGERARTIGAPMLVTNRIGASWAFNCQGGCVAYSAQGEVLAKANREGREEILMHTLKVSSS